MTNTMIWTLIIAAIVIAVIIMYRKTFKKIKEPSVCLITGGVKTGKSLLSVKLSTKNYIKRWIKWWLVVKILRRKKEEPLYYTNCYINFGKIWKKLNKNIRYITKDHLLRDSRFKYGSVIYIQEASLLADNMDYNNKERNVDLSLYNKLIGHMTRGGVIYYDTQSPLDCHYSIKRVCSTYFFIQKSVDFFFFRILYVRELINQENGVNAFDSDADDTMKLVFVGRWYYKRYNRYEYSYLTDDLDAKNVPYDYNTRELLSFNPLYVKRGDKRKKGDNK